MTKDEATKRAHKILGKHWDYRGSPLSDGVLALTLEAKKLGNEIGYKDLYRFTKEINIQITYGGPGVSIEMSEGLIQKAAEDLECSLRVLEESSNKVNKVNDILLPILVSMVKKIRDVRMNVVTEFQKTLTIMQDVRRFFLEDDYEKEVARLERFVTLGERLKALIEDGTFDAICDAALRLAVKETDHDHAERESTETRSGDR